MVFWILEWMHPSHDVGDEYGPVAALLPGDLPPGKVVEHVQVLHDARAYTQDELLGVAKRPDSANHYRPKITAGPHGPAIDCGHSPFLSAVRGKNVRMEGNRIVYDFAE